MHGKIDFMTTARADKLLAATVYDNNGYIDANRPGECSLVGSPENMDGAGKRDFRTPELRAPDPPLLNILTSTLSCRSPYCERGMLEHAGVS